MSDLISALFVAFLTILATIPFILHSNRLSAAIRKDLIRTIEKAGGRYAKVEKMRRLGDARASLIEVTFHDQQGDFIRQNVMCKFYPLFFSWEFYWDRPLESILNSISSDDVSSKEEIIHQMQTHIDSLEQEVKALKMLQ